MTQFISTESNVLHQLIQLLNCTHTQYPEIIEKVAYKIDLAEDLMVDGDGGAILLLQLESAMDG